MKIIKTTIELSRQVACKNEFVPTAAQMKKWVAATLIKHSFNKPLAEITIRATHTTESAKLNQEYRGKTGPTNVLSFPDSPIPGFESNYLGDLVICVELVKQEALAQEIELKDHWAHLVIHGSLHLLGYDHIEDSEAETMEKLEVAILEAFGIKSPY